MKDVTRRWGGGPYDRPLNVVIVTQEDPFYIGAFFREFLGGVPDHGDRVRIHGVMVQPSLGNTSRLGLAGRIWSLYGTLGFVRMLFRYAASKAWGTGIDGFCRTAGITMVELPAERSIGRTGAERPPRENNVNGAAFHAWLREREIDLVISVSASQIFGKTMLGIPRIGAINLHNAPLPRYRGMLPNFWQMYHGERESVLTIHEMVPELDAGDVLFQARTPITPGMSLEELMTITKENSARALWAFLDELYRGEATARPLAAEGSYFTWPNRTEAREFRRRGYRVS
ncbi:MAG: formyltransferase family protein [Spirochaeta sp.]|jgi:methionyl-tRNA formyltransferase|nr:formyltransferase family protein [Spirochaeta sp.]